MARVKRGYEEVKGKEILYNGFSDYAVFHYGKYTGSVQAVRGVKPYRNAAGKWPARCGECWIMETIDDQPAKRQERG
jgi:hypothetical protein